MHTWGSWDLHHQDRHQLLLRGLVAWLSRRTGAACVGVVSECGRLMGSQLRQCRSCFTSRRPVQFPYGLSVAGGGVDDGLMRFNRFNRSATDECEGKGNENESLFHSRIPSLTVSVCPGWRRVAVTKITECSFQDLPLLPFGAHGGELRQAAGTVGGAAAEKRGVTRLQGRRFRQLVHFDTGAINSAVITVVENQKPSALQSRRLQRDCQKSTSDCQYTSAATKAANTSVATII